jgi:ADP-heptose:LPS heptosyltransferase
MKILLVRLSSFGDVVFTLPLAKALRGEGDRLA